MQNKRSRSSRLSRPKPEEKVVDWKPWLEHWDTWSAIVGESEVPECGMFGCDEKVKVGNKWKCVKCGKVTTIEQELGE